MLLAVAAGDVLASASAMKPGIIRTRPLLVRSAQPGFQQLEQAEIATVERARRLRRHAFEATRLDARPIEDRLDLVDHAGELSPRPPREHRECIVVDRGVVTV